MPLWPGRYRLLLALFLALPLRAVALDHVTLRRDGQQIELSGRVEVKAADGGLLLLARDGELWTVQPEELIAHTTDDAPFRPFTPEEMEAELRRELPEGFEFHRTAHYVVCHNTTRAYAQWAGSLLERLYMTFRNYWSKRGFDLHEADFPLAAIVFADQQSYRAYSSRDDLELSDAVIGYYNLRTNRILMYDLTGAQALLGHRDRRASSEQISQLLSQPDAERLVATVIHEATHQIAFNCGMGTRYADIPLWVSEGIAVYFETPDLSSAKGWRQIGAINQARWLRFQDYAHRRPADSLETLLSDDERMRDPRRASDAYAEAWALTYFLVKQRPKQYEAYLKAVCEKTPLVWDDPKTRLEEFRRVFGSDLSRLDADFLRYMSKLR